MFSHTSNQVEALALQQCTQLLKNKEIARMTLVGDSLIITDHMVNKALLVEVDRRRTIDHILKFKNIAHDTYLNA